MRRKAAISFLCDLIAAAFLSVASNTADAFLARPTTPGRYSSRRGPAPPSPIPVPLSTVSVKRDRLSTSLFAEIIVINLGGDENADDQDDDDEEEEQGEKDPYVDTAKTEFLPTDDEPIPVDRSIIQRGDKKVFATETDWGGALETLQKRVKDIESGQSQDPSHALFRVMSSQTPNQQISQFVASTKPEVVQAMSGAVTSLLGGLWQPMNGAEVVVKASGDKISSLCFQLQMTGYMFRNAEYVMALKNLMDIQPSATTDDYRQAFNDLDTDRSGFIDAAEVKVLLDKVYEGKAPAFEIDSFIRFFDRNKDGKISWDEFDRGLGSALAQANKAKARLKMLTGYDDDDDVDDLDTRVEPTVTGELEIELESGKIIKVEAAEYIKNLKDEARALKAALRREKLGLSNVRGNDKNRASVSVDEFGGIAAYIASRQGDLKALTDGISPEIVETMKKLINFVLEGGDSGKVPKNASKEEIEMTIPGAALHQLALWQLVLGYRLREAEATGEYLKLLE